MSFIQSQPISDAITLEQLIDIVQQDLTFSGLFEKILPDKEIKRIIKEIALPWFYKNYQFALQKVYFYMCKDNLMSDVYTLYKYFIMPDEIEGITRILKIDDPSLFHLGIQAPHLSINLGVTNQPFLTSFVTTVGDLAVYRSILSAFSSEINKMNPNYVKYNFNHIGKRLHFLDEITTDLMLECFIRIQPEDLFGSEIFKQYTIGMCRVRTADALLRFTFNMPGGFNYNAAELKTSGTEMLNAAIERVNKETKNNFFIMQRTK